MTRSIFTVGGTVQAGGGRYIHRKVDEHFLSLCRDGEFCYVLTARQMGKSSLMVRTAQRLADEGAHCAIVDLSQVGVIVTPAEWYLGVLTAIEDSIHLETDIYEWWESHSRFGLAQRMTQFFQDVVLQEIPGRVVVLFDEIDSTLSLDFTDDFFAAIRYIYNARSKVSEFRRISFTLVGVATPSDLIGDPKRTPFNIGRTVDLEYFTLDEAYPLAEGFSLPPHEARQVLRWIIKWTNGHPFLTQRLCHAISHAPLSEICEADVDQIVSDTFFGDKAEQDSNLRFVNDMLTLRSPDSQAVLTMHRDIISGRRVRDDRQSHIGTHLKLSGIVRGQDGFLRIQNDVYRHVFDHAWIRSQWPEHWIKRVPPVVIGLAAACFAAMILLGVTFTQMQKRGQEQQRREQVDRANAQLSGQVRVSDSLNARLRTQISVSDSLRALEHLANKRLSIEARRADSLRNVESAANSLLASQILISDSLRVEEARANATLSRQINVVDSLRTVAEDRLELARISRLQTMSVALANTAIRQTRLGNPGLGALLARQAFLFGTGGRQEFLDPVYDALRQSLNALGSSSANDIGGPVTVATHAGGVRSVSFSSDGSWVASGGEDGLIGVAPSDAGQDVRFLSGHRGTVRAVAYLPTENALISVGDDGTLRMWREPGSRSTGAEVLLRSSQPLWAACPTPDGSHIAVGDTQGRIGIWLPGASSPTVESRLGSKGRITDLEFSPDGKQLGIVADNGAVGLWSWQTAAEPFFADTRQKRLTSVTFAPDGQFLATAGDDFTVTLWRVDAIAGEIVRARTVAQHEGPVNSVAFSPDGTHLASGSGDNSIQVWNMRDNRSPILLQEHTSWVWSVAYGPRGERLVSGGADRKVRVWNTDPSQLARRVCDATGDRVLSRAEWEQFIGADFPYDSEYQSCSTKSNVTVLRE